MERSVAKCELDLSAVILAGGQSQRMGRDKAWLELDGKPLIQRAVETVRVLGLKEVFISGRTGENYAALQCPVLLDLEPGFGPLGGIERGLHACTAPLLLVMAVDLPRMGVTFLARMRQRCDRLTGVVSRLHGELEPLVAIYPKYCHEIAFGAIARCRHSARDFASACLRQRAVRICTVTRSEASCFDNWNRPADLPGPVVPATSCNRRAQLS